MKCSDGDWISDRFGGQDWRDVPESDYDHCTLNLEMTPAGFQYYLPGLIAAVVTNPSSALIDSLHAAVDLPRACRAGYAETVIDALTLLTVSQVEMVIATLEYAAKFRERYAGVGESKEYNETVHCLKEMLQVRSRASILDLVCQLKNLKGSR